jgi:6-phospho-3-hexuloisomerase
VKNIFNELNALWASVDEAVLDEIVHEIIDCKGNIICLGAGRMGYGVQAFAMRLSHLGFNAFMIGDTTLPRINNGDLIIVNSSSGETPSIALLADLAKDHGGKLLCFTSGKHSTLAKMSDLVLLYEKYESAQLMKSLYEQFSFLLFDHIASKVFLAGRKEKSWVENNHSVLE